MNRGARPLRPLRRTALQALATTGALAVLTACGSQPGDTSQRSAPPTAPPPPATAPHTPTDTTTAPPAFRGRMDVTFRPETPRGDAELQRTAALMRKRAAALGMKNVEITVTGGDVTVSATNETEERLTSLGTPAEVAFRPVLAIGPPSAKPCTPPRDPAPSRPTRACGTGPEAGTPYQLGPVGIAGSNVEKSTAEYGEHTGAWLVALTFDTAGSRRFTELTGRLAAQQQPMNQFAIVRDGEVLSAPTVNQALTGGRAEISGSFTRESAQELAAQITSGSLPLRLRVSSVQRYS
ncbi:SecDF P1 head subdomain-containing protein [Streptomyces sp. NPDC087440]|uniref:SecDF P1 head subdomain-containing protein n=1 Tax=Streptomyces sp. NPDC087440 TaxID=3365790 RepID=UPI0038004F4C